MVVVFTGGTGGTKLVQGLQQVVAPENLTVIVNTGDDIEWWGLHVSPDIDSVLYGLAGLLSTAPRLGRGERHLPLPGSHEATGAAVMVQPGRSRSGDPSHAYHLAAGWEVAESGDRRARGQARHSRPRAAHVGRPRLHHARHRQRYFDISGIFRARAASSESGQGSFRGRPPCPPRSGRDRGHRSGGSNHLRAEQSGHQHRADSGSAGNPRCLATVQGPGCGGQPHRWRGVPSPARPRR